MAGPQDATLDKGRMLHSDNKILQFVRSVLAVPAAYNLWWKMVGGLLWSKRW